MRYRTSVACNARITYGLTSRRYGGQNSKYAVSPWLEDSSKPFWVEYLVSTLDGPISQQNGRMPDLHHEFQALCAHGNVHGAFDVLLQLEGHGQFLCERDYICLLKACSKKKAHTETKQIQAHFAQHSSKVTPLLKDFLLNALVKCGAHDDALHTFETLQHRTVHSWNSVITASADSGKPKKAFEFYRLMQEEGIEANEHTFVSLFKACGSLRHLKFGKDLHAEANRKGFLSDVYVGSTLVSMYGKCGDVAEAENVFANLVHRNVVTWNVMLSVYVDHGQIQKALRCFSSMKQEGVSPEEATFVITLQACSMLGEKEEAVLIDGQTRKMEALMIGKALHDELKRKGFQSHPFIGSSLVNMYGKCGGIKEAESVFCGLTKRDVVSWTAMLAAYVVQGQGEIVLELYKKMQKEGLSPDEHTLVIALQGCCLLAEKEPVSFENGQTIKQESLNVGRFLHEEARKRRFEANVFVASSLVMMYSKCGDIVEAEKAFGCLSHLDSIVWNSMLSAYVDQGQGQKAIELFKQMIEEGACLDDVTLVCILQACSELGEVKVCEEIHFSSVSAGCQLSLPPSLIHAYGSCARMVDAEAVFEASSKPGRVLWSALIAGFCREGSCFACLQTFEMMQFACTHPDRVIFLCLLSACSHDGLVHEGVDFFNLMSKEYNLLVEVRHVVSLFDLLGRAGDFRKLKSVLSRMPVQPDETVWLCLMSACRSHGNVEMGKFAFDHVVRLQSKGPAAYVLMSNIYVEAGMFDSASQLDTCTKELGAWEQGWLDVNRDANLFIDGQNGVQEDNGLESPRPEPHNCGRRQCETVVEDTVHGRSTRNFSLTDMLLYYR
ncbi:hypothetical protein GOP47_0015142 [Adiantum capillus-veneris]|uniref:Pentatricopeptide repeat-containing protein n=1 Tax=Adiantum capillus-veneris TaxID=13818 RepID=A0A9D4UNE0_ADICA|nr:hypothetical protein GOP47_0015142 [Adiantum capillus-veneris]